MKKTILRFISIMISVMLCFSVVSVAADEVQEYTDSISAAFDDSGISEMIKEIEDTTTYGTYGTYTYALQNYCGAKNRDGGVHAITSYNTNENTVSYSLDIPEDKVLDKLASADITMRMTGSDTLSEIGVLEMRYLVKSSVNYFAIRLDYVNQKAYAVVMDNGTETKTEISDFTETGFVPISISVNGTAVSYSLALPEAGTKTGTFEVSNIADLLDNCEYIWQISSKAASGALRFCWIKDESFACSLKTQGTESSGDVESIPLTGEVGEYAEDLGSALPVENAGNKGEYGSFTPYINGMISARSTDGSLRIYAYTNTENYVEYKMNIPGRRFVGLQGADIVMRWQGQGENTIQETRFLVSKSADSYFAFGLNIARKKSYFKVVDSGAETVTEIDIEPQFNKKVSVNFNIEGTTLSYTVSAPEQDNVSGTVEIPNIEELNKECVNHTVYYAKDIVEKGQGMVFFDSAKLKCATLPLGDVDTDSLKSGYADEEGECELSYGLIDKTTGEPITSLEAGSTITLYGIGENYSETDADALVMLALYKDGIPQKLIPYNITLPSGMWTNYKSSAELALPEDVTGCSVKCFLWRGFDDIRTSFDFIEVK